MSHFNLKEAAISQVSRLPLREAKQSFSVKSVHRNKMTLLDSHFVLIVVTMGAFLFCFLIFPRLHLLSSFASTLDVTRHK